MSEKINLSLSNETEKGKIDIGFVFNGKVVVNEKIIPLNMTDLVNEFVALGFAKKVLARTGTSFIIFNPEDCPELDFEAFDDYDVSG